MTLQVRQAPILRRKMSYEEFLEWDGENQHVEWVDGKVIAMAPVGDLQQDLKGFLLSLLRIFTKHFDLGAIRDDPFQMKTGEDLPGRAPDIIFIAKARLPRLRKEHLEGPADLVIEISGPGSRKLDKDEKFKEYEHGGVREYWLLDPQSQKAEFYRLRKDGKFHIARLGRDGVYHSNVIKGLWLRVEWLWQKPLPSELAVFREWGLVK